MDFVPHRSAGDVVAGMSDWPGTDKAATIEGHSEWHIGSPGNAQDLHSVLVMGFPFPALQAAVGTGCE